MLELGFRPVLNCTLPYGFDVGRTVPGERWLREKQRTLDHRHLQDLFHTTVHALQEEIPGLGEVVAFDVKHQYAWVRENNPRESIKDRFCKDRQPRGDPDCRVGVKSSTNQEQPDGSKKEKKEYLWGYGSGIATATTPDYGDVVVADLTQGFNESDVSYYLRLYIQSVAVLGLFPLHVTADAAYDAWYVYQTCAHRDGIAAIPLNQHGHPDVPRDHDGVPLCPIGLRMHPTYRFMHTKGYQAQRYRCPLLFASAHGSDLRARTIRQRQRLRERYYYRKRRTDARHAGSLLPFVSRGLLPENQCRTYQQSSQSPWHRTRHPYAKAARCTGSTR